MKYFLGACALAALNTTPAASAVIGFDYNLSGSPINAEATFNSTRPSAPVPGPIVSEYRKAGVTFRDGVILSYGAFAGPTDTRASSGSFLETPPNLLASSDFFSLSDGTSLPGRITASLEFPASVVTTSIRNGFTAANFTMSAYSRGTLVDSSSTELGDFLGPSQDGTLTVSGIDIDEVRIQSSQPIGSKNFGIDGFEYVPISSEDALHASFELSAISAQPSPQDQDLARRNFSSTLKALIDLDEDGKATGEEAFLFAYDKLDQILFALDTLAGKATATFIILPCGSDTTILNYSNCGEVNHLQVESSLFDLTTFDVAVEYSAFDDISATLRTENILSLTLDGYDTIAKVTLFDTMETPDGIRADYRIQTISDVTPAPIPLPSAISMSIAGIFAFPLIAKRRRRSSNKK